MRGDPLSGAAAAGGEPLGGARLAAGMGGTPWAGPPAEWKSFMQKGLAHQGFLGIRRPSTCSSMLGDGTNEGSMRPLPTGRLAGEPQGAEGTASQAAQGAS